MKERGQQKGEERTRRWEKKEGGGRERRVGTNMSYVYTFVAYIVAYICVPFDACTRLMFICGTKTYVVLIRYTLF